jgi:uncharacterized repeat protein (TIGR01451 family)
VNRRTLRRAAAIAAAISLALVGGIVVQDNPAEAVFASGGAGRFRSLIDWFEWGSDTEAIIQPGRYQSQPRVIAGTTILTACTISNIGGNVNPTGGLRSKKPGSYGGDSLDDLYNSGQVDQENTMFIGLANRVSNETVWFDFDCEMTVDGVPVEIPGLVVADAESSNGTPPANRGVEYVQARPFQEATWRIIDRYRGENCKTNSIATVSGDNTLRLNSDGAQCSPQGSPTAVAFMDGAHGAHVQLYGEGNSAVALGVVSYVDFGDAPDIYGAAGVFGFPTWSGGALARNTTTNVFEMAQLGDVNQPGVRLGHRTDGEPAPPFSLKATGDDLNAAENDEDLEIPASITGYRGGTVVIDNLVCAGPGGVYGWIDFNENSQFDSYELSGPVPASPGQPVTARPIPCGADLGEERTLSLAWNVPDDAQPTPADHLTMVRIGITTDERVDREPIGLAINGELEDHSVDFQLDPYTITKTSDGATDVRAGRVVTYTIVVSTPVGDGSSTTPRTITVRDDLSDVLDDATFITDSPADTSNPPGAFQFDPTAQELTWTGPTPPPGGSISLTYSVMAGASGNSSLNNVAWVNNPLIKESITCEINGTSGRDPVTDEPCAISGFDEPHLTLAKTRTSSDPTGNRAGTVVTYQITATNDGEGNFTQALPAVVMDDLAGVLDDADYLADASASLPWSFEYDAGRLRWSGALASHQSVTLTYSVRLRSIGDGVIRNVAWVPADPDDPDPDTPTCQSNPDPLSDETCVVSQSGQPKVAITKSMTANPDPPVPGGTVSYTVTATNTGAADFSTSRPLFLADDISDVLDGTQPILGSLQATIDGNPVATPTWNSGTGRVYWIGPLAQGKTVIITYSLTIQGQGNGVFGNTAWAPRGQNPPGPGDAPPVTPSQCDQASGRDLDTEEPCAEVTHRRPLLTLSKTVSTDPALGPIPGTRVTYTITGANTGQADYTDTNPVPIWDDLSDILTGAVYNNDATASQGPSPVVDAADGFLKWSGPLGVGKSVTITYSVTLLASGAASSRNVVWVPRTSLTEPPDCDQPTGTPDDPDTLEVCAAANLTRPLLAITKVAASPADDARAGDSIHYTVTATNIGTRAFTTAGPALVRDNIAGTLDDSSTPANLAASQGNAPTYSPTTQNITWSGVLAVNASVTISYDVTLRHGGDGQVSDTAWAPTSRTSPTPPTCTNPTMAGADPVTGEPCARVDFGLPRLTITKTATPTNALVGQDITFRIALRNDSNTDYSSARPALLVDSLADTLANATMTSPPQVVSGPVGNLTLQGSPLNLLTYQAPLTAGQETVIEYTVKLNSAGDGQISNIAWEPSGTPGQDPPTCLNSLDGLDPATGDPCSRADQVFPVLRINKSSDLSGATVAGDPITYTVTVTNVSTANFTATNPAELRDDLTGVIPGCGDYIAGSLNAASGTASDIGLPVLSWSGELAAGTSTTITYQIEAKQCGTSNLVNVAWQPADPAGPPVTPACNPPDGGVDPVTGEPCSRTDSPTRTVELTKAVSFLDQTGDPVGSAVAGGKAVYTVTAVNSGTVDYTAAVPLVLRDDLSQLLQGASLDPVGGFTQQWSPSATDSGLFQSRPGGLSWRGSLLAGQTVTLTYSATLNAVGLATVGNTIWEPANPYNPNPPVPECSPGSTRDADTGEACAIVGFDRPLLQLTKTASPSADPMATGGTVTYTVSFTNVGSANFDATNPARVYDSLAAMGTGVIYNNDAYVEAAGLDATTGLAWNPAAKLLTWSGSLAQGQSGSLTYSVTLAGDGPASLVNTAWTPTTPNPTGPPASCAAPICAQTTTPRALMHIDKTVQSPDTPRVGDKLTYTIRLRNIGNASYTETSPAVLFDDLTDVLANATVNTDVQAVDDSGTPTGSAIMTASGRLTWEGPLPAGDGVTITFSIILTGEGDTGAVYNMAWSPTDPDDLTPPTGCPVSDEVPDPNQAGRCAAAETGRTNAAITKRILSAPAVPSTGDIVQYEVTMTNTGSMPFTAERPAVLADDLTEVLSTAIYLRDATATYSGAGPVPALPTYIAPRLTWAGPLDVNQTVTLIYSVQLRGSTVSQARNVAWTPADPFSPLPPPTPVCAATNQAGPVLIGQAGGVDATSGEPCAAANLSRAMLTISKAASPAGPAAPGDELTYTITVENTSAADFTSASPAVVWDDLTSVLAGNDAEYVAGSLTSSDGTASDTNLPKVRWEGPLEAGASATFSYRVKITAQGDGWFRNVTWVPLDRDDPDPPSPPCVNSTDGQPTTSMATSQTCAGLNLTGPVMALTKSSRPTGTLVAGQIVTYTIEASNVGAGPFTTAKPMVVLDDLSGLLDDAVLVGQPTASRGDPPTISNGLLRWSGPVPNGQGVQLTYQVQLRGTGDGTAKNLVWQPLDPSERPPVCDQAAGATDPTSGEVCASDSRLLPKLTLSKELLTEGPYSHGKQSVYQITITNTGQANFTAANPAVVIDDLSDILDGATFAGLADATVVDPSGVGRLTYNAPLLRWSGPLAVSQTVTLTFSVTWLATGDGHLRNLVWQPINPSDPLPPGCGQTSGPNDPSSGEPCAVVDVDRPLLALSKTSDGHDRQLGAGDVMTYTITASNVGQANYTAASPAVVMDDISDVIDGGVFNNDLTATIDAVTVAPPVFDPVSQTVRWEGALDQGETVEIKFSTTLNGAGDGVSRNVVWSPAYPAGPGSTPPTCTGPGTSIDPVSGEPCAVDQVSRPTLTIDKSSDAVNPRPGDTVKYTLVIANASLFDFTASNPAVVYDYMADVLDDATFAGLEAVTVSPVGSGQLSYQEPVLVWRGPLASGDVMYITVEVVLTQGGDGLVRNVAWRPNDQTSFDPPGCDRSQGPTDPVTAEPCGVDEFSKTGLSLTKTSSPADPMPGTNVTYTLTLVNTGQLAFTEFDPAWLIDDLSDVLATGDLVAGPTVTPNVGQVSVDQLVPEGRIAWRGPLAPNDQIQLTYTIKLDDTMAATHSTNIAWVPRDPTNTPTPSCVDANSDGSDDTTQEACAKVSLTPPVLAISKLSTIIRPGSPDPPAYPRPGDQVLYTLTVHNAGTGAYSPAHPAVVIDSLANVLDDATWDGTEATSPTQPGDSLTWDVTRSRLSWSGTLAPNQTVTITYSVTVKAGGDGQMSNVVWVPTDPDLPGDPPECDPDAGSADWLACDQVPIPVLRIAKSFSQTPTTGHFQAGVRLTYSLALSNTGQGDFTQTVPATVVDDLSDILDDGIWAGISSQPADGLVTWNEPILTWTGPIPANQTVVLSYSVDLTTGGDGDLRNLAWSPADPSDPSDEPACSAPVGGVDPVSGEPCALVDIRRPILEVVSKTVSPASGIKLGDWLTYTVVARNTGAAPFTAAEPAVLADSLARVLDDTEPLDLANVSDGGAGGQVTYNPPLLSWSGPLGVGDEVRLTYKLRLARGGDGLLRNAAWVQLTPGTDPPDPCAPPTPPDTGTRPDCEDSVIEVPVLAVSKSVSLPANLRIGSVVTYTITVTNVGRAPYTAQDPAVMSDDMSDVLDDATYLADAQASLGSVEFAEPRLVWSGELAANQSASITYSMRLKTGGDLWAHNIAWVTADQAHARFEIPPTPCGPGCSEDDFDVPPDLGGTGPAAVGAAALAAVVATVVGLILLTWRRRLSKPSTR